MKPGSEAELADMVAAAQGPLEIFGGGSRKGLGNAVVGDRLEVGGLSGISLYDPGALTLAVKAGTPLVEVEAALVAENQMLPFEPMDHATLFGNAGRATVGGMVAVNASGPRRLKAGACRDSLIGLRYVNGQGQIIKNGGRVMKNVTGYDLVKLMAGAHGTLGVITEVAFKLLPKPEATATLHFELGLADGLAKLREVMASPYDISAAAYADGAALLRLEGFAESVAYRAGKIGGDKIEGAGPWAEIKNATALAGADAVWRLSVKPSDAAALVAGLAARGFSAPVLDWSGGLIWLSGGDGSDAPRQAVSALGGHATCIIGAHTAFQPENPVIATLNNGLRQKFDPRGIFNQGRMG